MEENKDKKSIIEQIFEIVVCCIFIGGYLLLKGSQPASDQEVYVIDSVGENSFGYIKETKFIESIDDGSTFFKNKREAFEMAHFIYTDTRFIKKINNYQIFAGPGVSWFYLREDEWGNLYFNNETYEAEASLEFIERRENEEKR